MVKNQLIPRGIDDQEVLRVMGKIQRHLFMEEALLGGGKPEKAEQWRAKLPQANAFEQ
jgi:protein-L-isoaspartate O-methyltransferase